WRQRGNAKSNPGSLGYKPRLEDYVRCHSALGSLERLPLNLIGEEYRARHLWGDRPAHAEYAARFVAQKPRLSELLVRIAAEKLRLLSAKHCKIGHFSRARSGLADG